MDSMWQEHGLLVMVGTLLCKPHLDSTMRMCSRYIPITVLPIKPTFFCLLLIVVVDVCCLFFSGCKGLDFVISEARKYGIRLILSLVNNYDSFGGKKQYVDWARSRGQYLGSVDDFFRNPVVKGFYKNHIRVRSSGN